MRRHDGSVRVRLAAAGCLALAFAAPARPASAQSALPTDPASATPGTASGGTKPAPVTFIGVPVGYRRAVTWDLNLDGALGSTLNHGPELAGFGRVRAGVLVLRDADVYALGPSYEYDSVEGSTFGVQGEYINDNSGLWAQIGGLLDVHARPGAMVSFGYTLAGVELQLRDEPVGLTWALYAKLRVPIGFLAYELANR